MCWPQLQLWLQLAHLHWQSMPQLEGGEAGAVVAVHPTTCVLQEPLRSLDKAASTHWGGSDHEYCAHQRNRFAAPHMIVKYTRLHLSHTEQAFNTYITDENLHIYIYICVCVCKDFLLFGQTCSPPARESPLQPQVGSEVHREGTAGCICGRYLK